jgi:monofunctional glycosyltransferase
MRHSAPVTMRKVAIVLLRVAIVLLIAVPALVLAYRFLPVPLTPLMVLRLLQGEGLAKRWVDYEELSPQLRRAVVASEDARFCTHYGFDWTEIEASWSDYQSGERLRGASTITQQTAKNLFLWPGGWLRKIVEIYPTVLLELLWPKRRILEIYLNIVEWGPGIYGAEAAAEHYFKKPAAELSPYEAVRLAAVLPDPLDRSASKPGPEVTARSRFMIEQIPGLPIWQPLPCGQPL